MAASKETLELLHDLVAGSLVAKIESGEATSADMANALRMLKENDITIIPEESDHLGDLREKLHKKKAHKPDLELDGKEMSDLLPN